MTDKKRKVHVIQRPPRLDHFDIEALNGLGDVEYLAPSAPNVQDPERLAADFKRAHDALVAAGEDDVFVALGGSPVSNWLFGAAIYASGRNDLNVALYSRDQDKDGARQDKGRYRIINMKLEFPGDA